MSSDEYVRVTAHVLTKTDKAVYLDNGVGEGWIPRSCIHAADDMALADLKPGDEHEFRIREWAAERNGLI